MYGLAWLGLASGTGSALLSMLAGSIGDNTTLIVTGPNVAFRTTEYNRIQSNQSKSSACCSFLCANLYE